MNKKNFLNIAVLIFVSVAVYANSLSGGFCFDDIHIVQRNPLVKSTSSFFMLFKKEYWASTSFETADSKLYRPLTMATYLITNKFFDGKPVWFHMGNIVINTMNVILVFLLCIRINGILNERNGMEARAFLCALVFAVHPVHVEAVSGIVGRAELLAGFFCLLAFYFYVGGKTALSLVFFTCGLFSKETTVALAVFVAVYERLFNKKSWKTTTSYFAVTIAYLAAKYFAIGGLAPSGTEVYFKGGITERIFTMSKVFVYYIKLMFVPYPLNPDWGQSGVIKIMQSFFEPLVLISIVLIGAVVFCGYKAVKAKPIVAFSILWFFVFLLPVSNIIPIGDLMAERFLYLPSFGFCMLVSDFVYRNRVFIKTAFTGAAIFAVLTVKQNAVWKDNTALWAYTAEKFPENWRAYWELGKCYREKNDAEKAAIYFKQSVRTKETGEVLLDLAVELRKKGDISAALIAADRHLVIDKNSAKGFVERAKIRSLLGSTAEAEEDFQRAVELATSDSAINYDTGRYYMLKGSFTVARKYFVKAVELDGKNAAALTGAGICSFQLGDCQSAINYFERALFVDEKYFEALYNLAVVYKNLGDIKKVEKYAKKLSEFYPEDIRVKQLKAAIKW